MRLSQWQTQQQRVEQALNQTVLPQLSRLLGRRLDESTIDLIAAAMFREVSAGRDFSERLARQYYEDLIADRGLGQPVRQPRLKPYQLPALRDGLSRTLATGSDREFTRASMGLALNLATKHIEDAGRRSMMATVFDDDRISGWAQSDPNPPTCAFCLMLISRGAVYKSEDTAGGMNRWHAGCSCKAVPVIGGEWEGRNQHEKAEQLWEDATDGASTDKLNAFRNAISNQSSALPSAA